MILITGSTGHLGTATIHHLLKHIPANKIVAFARDENKAKHLKDLGVEIRLGTFDDTASIEKAMVGIEKVLLVSGLDPHRFQQHKNVVDASKKAGVTQLTYTSVAFKDYESSAIKSLMESHFQTEDYIKASGLNYTILRNTLYTDGIPMFVGEKVFETGIILPAGEGKVPYALRNEMAEAATNIFLNDQHKNKSYTITGSELYSYADIAKTLSELTGKTVHYTNVDVNAFSAQLKQMGLPEHVVYILTGFSTDTKNQQFEMVSNDLETLIGRKPTSLKDGLKKLYNL